MSEITSDFNYSMHRKVQDNTTLTVADVTGGVTASVVDFAASTWNSLPGTTEVDTADLLKRVSTDALRVYEEHPDAIHAASFIGGMFVPMGVAVKGMNILRNGAKGASWFGSASKAGRELELANVAKIFEEAGPASKAYRDSLRSMYAKTAVNQAVDAIAMETALVGMMNAHPLMEDYMEDFGSNFALSTAFGGVLGGGIGHIADRFILKEMTGKISTRVFDETIGKINSIHPGNTNVSKLHGAEANLGLLDNIMAQKAANGLNETNDMGYAMAKSHREITLVEQDDLFEAMLSPELKALGKPEKEQFKRMLIGSKEMAGVEDVRLLTEAEFTAQGFQKPPKALLTDEPALIKTTSKAGPTTPANKEAIYFPELGLYGVLSDAKHYAGASVYGITAEKMAATLPRNWGKIPNLDSSLELASKSSAQIQRDYIARAVAVDKMSLDDLKKMVISETDGPTLNALIMRMAKDEEAKKILIESSDRSPVYKKILEERTEQLISEGKLAGGGPDATYAAAMDRIGKGDNISSFDPRVAGNISVAAGNMLSDWIGGAVTELRKAAVDYFGLAVGGYAKGSADGAAAATFKEIYESAESRNLRAEFLKLADSNGDVYLYRGVKSHDIKGHAPVESYTTHVQKASQFTGTNSDKGVKLYKVHVEDIIAGFKDIGSGEHNAEILVRAPARRIEAELSDSGKVAFHAEQGVSATKTTIKTTVSESIVAETNAKKVGFAQLQELMIAQKQDAIDTLLAQGFPEAVIAKKTNTDSKLVEAYVMGRQSGVELKSMYHPEFNATYMNEMKTVEDAAKILSPTNQPLVLSGNVRKAQYLQNAIGLNGKNLSDMNKLVTLTTMYGSGSSAAKEVASLLDSMGPQLDILKQTIGKVNNDMAGSAFFGSFDFMARRMGDVGPVVSFLGKEFQNIGNRLLKKVVAPIEEAMTTASKDSVAVIEFQTAMNVNAKLKGWRQWDADGFLVQKVEKVGTDGKKIEVLEKVQVEGTEYQIKTPSVLKLVQSIQDQSTELRNLSNTINKIQGKADISDIGFWVPSFNPVNKFISYVHNEADDTVQLLWAKTAGEHKELVDSYKKHLMETGQSETVKVYQKGTEQQMWSMMNGRLDTVHMARADLSLEKMGKTSTALVKSDTSIFGEIAGGYDHYVSSQMRNLADIALSDITDPLRKLSSLNRWATNGQPLDKIKKLVTAPKDTAAVVHNTLLGSNNLGEYQGWQTINRSFETYLTVAANKMGEVYDATIKPLTKTFLGGRKELTPEQLNKINYEQVHAEMEKRGVYNPWKQFDDEAAKMFGLSKIEDHKDTSKRIIYASNALAATVALRFGEIAQPIVNAMSLPILTSLAIANKMPDTFLGVQKGTARVSGTQIMYEGGRAMNSPLFESLNKRWESLGYFEPLVSEVSNLMRASRKFEPGITAKIENALDSKIVSVMSKPADYSEALTRKLAMNTGAVLAKRLYPELDDVGVTIFARDFMDKAIGNFHASQRPVFFQGTLGVALGLFQTYSLTLGQSIYRHLELKNYKALGKAALLQSAIFGTKSLPGFDAISNSIGDNFSDENVDLVTGTYRAVGDKAADFALYGLPSNLGPSFSARGDSDPRPPLLNPPVAYNMVAQTMDMMGQVKTGLDADFPDMARSLAQSISLQSMSRPLARTAELATGYSITRQGTTVQVPEEVWTPTGIFARILGTRPIEEQKLREADHMRRFYGAIDSKNRDEAINKLQTAIRNGTLTDEKIGETALKYLDNGGSPRGWQAAVNKAIAKTETSGREVFVEKLRPDSPLMHMIDSRDGE